MTPSTAPKDVLGRLGEDAAAAHLQAIGLQILDRNWRCARGELDIVALEGEILVFCEVKTRSSAAFGTALEAVGASKAARIRSLALLWLAEHRSEAGVGYRSALRFDVVAVLRSGPATPVTITHVRAAF